MKKRIWVVDIGGSSVKHGLWDGKELSDTTSFLSPPTWEEMKNQLRIAKEQISKRGIIEGVSFSLPGIVNQKTGFLEGASSLRYLHQPCFREEMSQLLNLPIAMENDANCATMAELTFGAGKKYDNLLFMVIGTGVGGTVVRQRKICQGANQFAGEFGMMLVNGYESLSEVGSAVRMARRYEKMEGLPPGTYTGQDIFDLAQSGVEQAKEAVYQLYHYLAMGLYNLQYICDPEVIILGGGISKRSTFIEELEQHLQIIMEKIPHSPIFPKLKTCHFYNDANLIGAGIVYDSLKVRKS